MTKSWADERLEERFDSIGRQFKTVDRRFDRVDSEFGTLRAEMNTRFDRLEARFDAMQRTMIQFSGALIAVLIAALVGIFAQI